jgi:hypothetical protein
LDSLVRQGWRLPSWLQHPAWRNPWTRPAERLLPLPACSSSEGHCPYGRAHCPNEDEWIKSSSKL